MPERPKTDSPRMSEKEKTDLEYHVGSIQDYETRRVLYKIIDALYKAVNR